MAVTRRRALALAGGSALGFATSRARAQTKRTVSIAIQFGTSHLATTVAGELGLFARHAAAMGLGETSFLVQRMSGSPAMNDALLSGNVDIGAYGPTALLAAWLRTRGSFDIRAIAACNNAILTLYSNAPEVRRIADIRPSDRIAVTATTAPQAILIRMAAEQAFGPGQASRFDRQMVVLPHPDATTALISRSSITLYFASPPFISTLEASGRCHKVIDGRDVIGGDYSGALLACTGRFASENPVAVNVVVAALREAMEIIRAEPRRVAEIYSRVERTQLPLEEVERAVRGQDFVIEPRGLMAFAAFMNRTGALASMPTSWRDAFRGPVLEGEGS